MRKVARIDANQRQIIQALRQAGATVQPIHQIGDGCPDLLVGFRGWNYLLEIKNGSRLTPDESTWHDAWRGRVAVVASVEDALLAIGAT